MNLTDMSALGASAGYYDFDSFQEMQVITGGADASISGSGTHLNMVTKRGTNEVHGSARLFAVDHHFQSDNLPDEAKTQVDSNGNPAPLAAGNSINSVQDYGAEVGGPVWKDHMWLWGSYGRDQINLITAGGATDNTTLEDFNAKFNWQIVPSNSVDVWYLRSDKLKFGRNAGLTRPQETSWNQTLPQNTWKVSDSQIVGSSLFLTAQYNGLNGNFTLDPQGDPNRQTFIDEGGVWHNTYEFFAGPRPQRQVKADASYFFNAGSVGNELKAGFGYLKSGARSSSQWPGTAGFQLRTRCGTPRGADLRRPLRLQAAPLRDDHAAVESLDRQQVLQRVPAGRDHVRPADGQRRACAGTSSTATTTRRRSSATRRFRGRLSPTVVYPGADKPFKWNDWQPRAGLTYALGTNRTTVLQGELLALRRGPRHRHDGPDQSDQRGLLSLLPLERRQPRQARRAGRGRLSDPFEPISRNYRPGQPRRRGLSQQFRAGLPRAADLGGRRGRGSRAPSRPSRSALPIPTAISASQLYRFPAGTTQADYTQYMTINGSLPAQFGGGAYSAPVYELTSCFNNPDTCVPPPGYTWTNRSDLHQTYDGVDLVLTKRLSNRWMMRGSFTYNVNKQHSGANGCVDPTNIVPGQSGDTGNPATAYTGESCADGAFVASRVHGERLEGQRLPELEVAVQRQRDVPAAA